jgi:hypothetical protein
VASALTYISGNAWNQPLADRARVMAKNGETRTGKKQVEQAERRRHALALRAAGVGYEDIAKQVGLSGPGPAYKIVQAALKATYREPADEVRKLELERLDRLTLALWQRAKGGESEAIDRVLKLMDRRAKLLGLDVSKPATVMAFDASTMTNDEIIARLASLAGGVATEGPQAPARDAGGDPAGEPS